jgi:hypothetical protein
MRCWFVVILLNFLFFSLVNPFHGKALSFSLSFFVPVLRFSSRVAGWFGLV